MVGTGLRWIARAVSVGLRVLSGLALLYAVAVAVSACNTFTGGW